MMTKVSELVWGDEAIFEPGKVEQVVDVMDWHDDPDLPPGVVKVVTQQGEHEMPASAKVEVPSFEAVAA